MSHAKRNLTQREFDLHKLRANAYNLNFSIYQRWMLGLCSMIQQLKIKSHHLRLLTSQWSFWVIQVSNLGGSWRESWQIREMK